MSYQKNYPNGWQSGESGGTPITPEALDNIENGIANALPKDGTDSMTANLLMGGHRVTDLGNPVSDGDAVPMGYAKGQFAPAVESAEHPGCYYRTVNGVVEWYNPPVYGVEYRTTERFSGKPVYVRAVNIGALPDSTTNYAHNTIPIGALVFSISGYGEASDGEVQPLTSLCDEVWANTQAGYIGVKTSTNLAKFAAVVTVKYTKA